MDVLGLTGSTDPNPNLAPQAGATETQQPAPIARQKRPLSAVAADLEDAMAKTRVARAGYEDSAKAVTFLQAEYEEAKADLESGFAEVEQAAGGVLSWIEKKL